MRPVGRLSWPMRQNANSHTQSTTRVVNRYKRALITSSGQLHSVLLLKIIIIGLISTAGICLLTLAWKCVSHPANSQRMTGTVSRFIPTVSESLRPMAESSNMALATSLFAYAEGISVLGQREELPKKIMDKATSTNPTRSDWLINIERIPLAGRFKHPNNSILISDQIRIGASRRKEMEEDILLDIEAGDPQISVAALDETKREVPLTSVDQLLPTDVTDVETE